jgi:hypothetical protein
MLRITSLAAAAALLGYAGLALAQQPAYSPGDPNRYATQPTGSNTMPDRQTMTPSRRTLEPGRQANAMAGQFTSEAEAKSHCSGDTVVWVNIRSHIYHFAGSKDYGNTKHGAFMCRADADRVGTFRAAKSELRMQGNTAQTTSRSAGSGNR